MTTSHPTLFKRTLQKFGVNAVVVNNAFDVPYHTTQGWPLKLPTVDWSQVDLLVLPFQDFVTFQDNHIVELHNIEEHYGEFAKKILVTHMHPGLNQVYHGPINLIEFSSHNYREVQVMTLWWEKWRHIAEHEKTQPWQCLNGRKCPHRKWTVNLLAEFGNGIISYGMDIPLPSWNITNLKGKENCDNFIGLGEVYSRCAVNIVTETLYDPAPGLFSEKTIHALAAQQIPIVIGSQGLVSSLQQHGFDMFEDVVDISYDTLPNDTRLPQAIQRNRDLLLGKIDLQPYQERLQAQREFLLDKYVAQLESKFVSDCQALLNKINL